jgi:asparaginyl-tRNA synthetase
MHIKDVPKHVGKDLEIKGWVWRKRESKGIVFLIIRDADGIIQCTVKEDHPDFGEAQALSMESSVIVKGRIFEDKRSPSGYEMKIRKLKAIHIAERFPITKDQSPEFLLDMRHLWLRSRKMNAVLKIRSTVLGAMREHWRSHGFIEYNSPSLIGMQCEGGSTLFKVDYYGEEVYLTQTWQLHAEPAIFSLEKIFTIQPAFRAEKSRTSRHLSELWMAEMEGAWMDFKDILDDGEAMIRHVVRTVLEKNRPELKILERDIKKLKPTLKKKFPRLTYDEVLDLLAKKKLKVRWGKDLRTVEEDRLSEMFDTPVIVTHYPKKVKAFYMKEAKGNPKVVLGYDMIAPEHYGEIIGGSQREENIEKIRQNLKEQKEDEKKYEFYFDTRKYGSVPHGGYGAGVERIISWICGLDNIKDAIAFPRTMLRWKP